MNGQNLTCQDEAELLSKAKTDRESFGMLYDYFAPQVFRYINLKVGFNKSLTEDLTEETFLKILEKLKGIKADPKKGFKPFLFTVARNTVFDYFRSKSSSNLSIEAEQIDIPDNSETAEEKLIKAENEIVVKKLLGTLSEEEREILALKFSDDLKYREIGVIMNKSEENIAVIIHRSLEKLRATMNNNV